MNTNLSRRRAMGMLWKVSHDMVDGSDIEYLDLPLICDELYEIIQRELCRRMHLKTASLLINGAARTYQLQVDQTLQEIGLKKRKSTELGTSQPKRSCVVDCRDDMDLDVDLQQIITQK